MHPLLQMSHHRWEITHKYMVYKFKYIIVGWMNALERDRYYVPKVDQTMPQVVAGERVLALEVPCWGRVKY